jgi:hypothetical protein
MQHGSLQYSTYCTNRQQSRSSTSYSTVQYSNSSNNRYDSKYWKPSRLLHAVQYSILPHPSIHPSSIHPPLPRRSQTSPTSPPSLSAYRRQRRPTVPVKSPAAPVGTHALTQIPILARVCREALAPEPLIAEWARHTTAVHELYVLCSVPLHHRRVRGS